MTKREVSDAVRRSFVMRSTKASAKLERRVIPAGHVRRSGVDRFVASQRSQS